MTAQRPLRMTTPKITRAVWRRDCITSGGVVAKKAVLARSLIAVFSRSGKAVFKVAKSVPAGMSMWWIRRMAADSAASGEA